MPENEVKFLGCLIKNPTLADKIIFSNENYEAIRKYLTKEKNRKNKNIYKNLFSEFEEMQDILLDARSYRCSKKWALDRLNYFIGKNRLELEIKEKEEKLMNLLEMNPLEYSYDSEDYPLDYSNIVETKIKNNLFHPYLRNIFGPSRFISIQGPQKVGKTWVLLSIALKFSESRSVRFIECGDLNYVQTLMRIKKIFPVLPKKIKKNLKLYVCCSKTLTIEKLNQFTEDCIVIDYIDLMHTEKNKDGRFAINDLWMELKAYNIKRNNILIGATQCNTSALVNAGQYPDLSSFGESVQKYSHVDCALAIGRSPIDIDNKRIYVKILLNRHGTQEEDFVYLPMDIKNGNIL